MNPFVEAVVVRHEAMTLPMLAQWHRAEAKYHQDTLDTFRAGTKPGPMARATAIQLRERAVAFHTACAVALEGVVQ